MNKFKIMWEDNPETPINASSLSDSVDSGSDVGGMLYKDIASLLPEGQGDFSDGHLKLRANTKIVMDTYATKAMLFNSKNTLTSHDSQFGPLTQDNIVFVQNSVNKTSSVYSGIGTTNLLSNSSFKYGWNDWVKQLEDTGQEIGYIDTTYGEEYGAVLDIKEDGFEGQKCVRMYNGAFGDTQISRTVNLLGKESVSLSFYYKSIDNPGAITSGLKIYIVSENSYWKDGNWNPTTSLFYELPPTGGEWEKFEIKDINVSAIQAGGGDVNLVAKSDLEGFDNYIGNFQLEELPFSTPYTEDIREDSLLGYPSNIIDVKKGYLEINILPKVAEDFTLLSLQTDESSNALELSYVASTDRIELRIWDIVKASYVSVSTFMHLSTKIKSSNPWTRIICSWDEDSGLKIITSLSPDIVYNNETFTPYGIDRLTSFNISSDNGSNIGNLLIDNLKINVDTKEDVDMIKDLAIVYTIIDPTRHKIFDIGIDALILDETLLDASTSFSPTTNYFIWAIDDLNEDTASIAISKSKIRPYNMSDVQNTVLIGGFRTDDNSIAMESSIWDITTTKDRTIHANRFMVQNKDYATDSNSYGFDIRTKPLAEENDIRSTMPIHFSDSLIGRHTDDDVITPESGIHNVQYFEVNTTGWMGIDNIIMDGSTISTRNYADSNGVFNDSLDLTVFGYDVVSPDSDNTPKIKIRAHEVDIDSGNRWISLDNVRVDGNTIYTKDSGDLLIDARKMHTENSLNLLSFDSHIQTNRDLLIDVYRNFTANITGNLDINTNGITSIDLIQITDDEIYTDVGSLHIEGNVNTDINSGSGEIQLDDLHIKDSLLHSTNDIIVETPGAIILGKTGTDATNPYTTDVIIRSDNFTVESQTVNFTNVNTNDFIRFDDIKMRQSEIYTDIYSGGQSIPMSINAKGNLSITSGNDIELNTSNKIEFGNLITGGVFNSNVTTTFNKDVYMPDTKLVFSILEPGKIDSLEMYATGTATNTTTILKHSSNNAIELSNDGIRIKGNLLVTGEMTTISSTNTEIQDSSLVINKSATTPINQDASFEVERDGLNAKIIWDNASSLWHMDRGDGLAPAKLIYDGYGVVGDNRYVDNVNIVTTDTNIGFKLENSYSVSGMELLSPESGYGLAAGEAIFNVGLNMDLAGGIIDDKADGLSVKAYMQMDTRDTSRNIQWKWQEPSDLSVSVLGGFYKNTSDNSNIESTAQVAAQAGNGFFGTPWIRTNAIEVPGEGGSASTGIFLGSGSATPAGTSLLDDEIVISTAGKNTLKVETDGSVTINGSGKIYTGTTNPSGTTRLNYDGHLYTHDLTTGNIISKGDSTTIYGPNTTGSKYLSVGGDGYSGNANTASMATTDGDLHLDAADGAFSTYLNFNAGTGGIIFGNGDAGTIGSLDSDGDMNITGTITASSFIGNSTTATTLETARTINGVSFNGSANITVEPYISNDDTGDTNCPLVFTANSTAGYKRLYEDSRVYVNNTNNYIYAAGFSGALSGNASTATISTQCNINDYTASAASNGNAYPVVWGSGNTHYSTPGKLYFVNSTGALTASKVYGAVGNDYADAIEIDNEIDVEFGYVYVRDENGNTRKSNKYAEQGVIGISTDTQSFTAHSYDGEKDRLPISVSGFVLAHCDKEYISGTPLTCTKNGKLTRANIFIRLLKSHLILATYYKSMKDKKEWNEVLVTDRHLVRVK